MKKYIKVLIILFLVGVGVFFYLNGNNISSLYPIQIQSDSATIDIKVELAVTPEDKSLGLMYRENLKEGRGMLFIYEKSSPVSFWMKNMLISIDMIFIGEDLEIKHIAHNVPPCPPEETRCPTYRPPVPVKYVLEVPSGYSEKNEVNVGDRVVLGDI